MCYSTSFAVRLLSPRDSAAIQIPHGRCVIQDRAGGPPALSTMDRSIRQAAETEPLGRYLGLYASAR